MRHYVGGNRIFLGLLLEEAAVGGDVVHRKEGLYALIQRLGIPGLCQQLRVVSTQKLHGGTAAKCRDDGRAESCRLVYDQSPALATGRQNQHP